MIQHRTRFNFLNIHLKGFRYYILKSFVEKSTCHHHFVSRNSEKKVNCFEAKWHRMHRFSSELPSALAVEICNYNCFVKVVTETGRSVIASNIFSHLSYTHVCSSSFQTWFICFLNMTSIWIITFFTT